jgi:hypothetical protein
MEESRASMLDYGSILDQFGDCSVEEMTAFLREELPYLWHDAYIVPS